MLIPREPWIKSWIISLLNLFINDCKSNLNLLKKLVLTLKFDFLDILHYEIALLQREKDTNVMFNHL